MAITSPRVRTTMARMSMGRVAPNASTQRPPPMRMSIGSDPVIEHKRVSARHFSQASRCDLNGAERHGQALFAPCPKGTAGGLDQSLIRAKWRMGCRSWIVRGGVTLLSLLRWWGREEATVRSRLLIRTTRTYPCRHYKVPTLMKNRCAKEIFNHRFQAWKRRGSRGR